MDRCLAITNGYVMFNNEIHKIWCSTNDKTVAYIKKIDIINFYKTNNLKFTEMWFLFENHNH